MNTIGDAFLKAFEPDTVIKVTSLHDKSVTDLLDEVHALVNNKYEIVLDRKSNAIYVGKVKQKGVKKWL